MDYGRSIIVIAAAGAAVVGISCYCGPVTAIIANVDVAATGAAVL